MALVLLSLLALTLCPGVPGRRLAPQEKQQLLAGHNWLRGTLPGADGSGQPLPRPADMNLLEWDEDLEAMAQEWADRCPRTYGYRECPSYPQWQRRIAREFQLPNLGQIILIYRKNAEGPEIDVSSAVNKTYSLRRFYHHGNRSCSAQPALCDSFTQFVWSTTRRVGCAMGTTCNHLVCNYHPQGNELEFIEPTGWRRKSFTQPGDPCTKCETGHGWCWNNLCVSNLTAEEGKNLICAIDSCEEGGEVDGCACRCPSHRLGNRCEVPCRDESPCADFGFSACSNYQILQSCPLLCQRCTEKPRAGDDWASPDQHLWA